ncbi:MAG: hydrogenase, partial [Bacteroidetes bacterium]|nr:hydrogenase [Bacteroidota bacterium]
MTNAFLEVSNGEKVALEKIPHLSFNDFHKNALNIVKDGGKVVQYFAYQDDASIKLMTVLRTDKLWVAGCDAPESYPSLTQTCEPFHMFEREVAEQFGIKPEDHPWLKMVRYHANYRNVADVFGNDYKEDIPGKYDYYQVDGDEIHEVAVGPVHAGVIEPGHFRFNCIGERVLNLEIQLGYQHRAVENLFYNAQAKRLPILAESIAGDTAIGHNLCMAQAVEALTAVQPDKGAQIIRVIAFELERIANHMGDLGALSGDVAFLPPANYCGRMRGDFLNLSLLICGNRFGKGLVRPGGVRFTFAEDIRMTMNERLDELKPQVEHTLDLIFSASTVLARFEDCGIVSTVDAEHLGLVGPAGRASGISYDVRRCFPTEHYSKINIPEHKIPSCDVYARAKVRSDEILQSIDIIQSLIKDPIETQPIENINYSLSPSSFVATVNEAWRGEVSHVLLTDKDGKILRYKVKDPSFHNWNGL